MTLFAPRFLLPAAALFAAFSNPALMMSACAADSVAGATALVFNRAGTQASGKGPADFFTGTVRVDMLNPGREPSRTATAYVTFEPAARSAWHTHPLGQTLIVTAGAGRVQQWGAIGQTIRSGDTVWIPPGVKHWHGAAPTTGMTHIAVTEQLDGKNVDWLEKVSDEQYLE